MEASARSKLVRSEHAEQSFLFQRLELEAGKYPELRLAFAVPNGSNKSMAMAAKFKKEGLKSGVPDIVLPVPRYPFHGLFVEMKRSDAVPSDLSPAQRDWLAALEDQGYAVEVCCSDEEALEMILRYIKHDRWKTNLPGIDMAQKHARVRIAAGLRLDWQTPPRKGRSKGEG
ncbi:MAG: VRR-NUC domain-containing protein [Gemmatimonadaceae bacterium]|nr:VRR-NUC domain-containing protein [Gemmatimonadaceae bacterium]